MKTLFIIVFLTLGLFSFSQPQVIADPNFSIGAGFNQFGIVYSTIIQPDGKIICGGEFTSFNGVARNRIVRLNTDGSIDATFNPTSGFNGTVYSLSVQLDGKIICGGVFTSINGVTRNRIARLNGDGSLDASFNPGTGFNIGPTSYGVKSMALQPDGKIICGGDFTTFNSVNRNRIARLNEDGTLDTSFNPGTGFNSGSSQYVCVFSIGLQPDGKIICGGDFSSFNGVNRNMGARLNSNGTLDATFIFQNGTQFYAIALQPDGKIITAWRRFNSNGTLDASFTGAPFTDQNSNGELWSLALQSDGKIIYGGRFTSSNGVSRNRIARLNTDGTLDTSFNPWTGFNQPVYSLSLQPDGKIICGGAFTSFNGDSRKSIARLELGYKTSFSITTNCSGEIYTWNGQNYSQSGTYTQVLVAQDGLDSVVTLNLTSPSPIDITFGMYFCPEVPYIWNNQSYNQPGMYTQVLSAQNGCDSTVNIYLSYAPPITTSFSANFCPEVPYIWNNQTYNQPGEYSQVFTAQNGCDSTVTLNLTYAPPITSSFSDNFCPGGLYLWNNQPYSLPGQYTQVLTAQNGCDSTVTLNLTFLPNNFNPTFSSANQLYTAPPFAVQFSNSTANASNYSFTW